MIIYETQLFQLIFEHEPLTLYCHFETIIFCKQVKLSGNQLIQLHLLILYCTNSQLRLRFLAYDILRATTFCITLISEFRMVSIPDDETHGCKASVGAHVVQADIRVEWKCNGSKNTDKKSGVCVVTVGIFYCIFFLYPELLH